MQLCLHGSLGARTQEGRVQSPAEPARPSPRMGSAGHSWASGPLWSSPRNPAPSSATGQSRAAAVTGVLSPWEEPVLAPAFISCVTFSTSLSLLGPWCEVRSGVLVAGLVVEAITMVSCAHSIEPMAVCWRGRGGRAESCCLLLRGTVPLLPEPSALRGSVGAGGPPRRGPGIQ
uniref:Uncharacterized protein n=1 Tax=Pipistrellus kuhlii TaxID=59472 RepID=A0A7J7SFW5_PIPKU|nr:hypothetical protein mPipKuh1_009973 [Pipistrellus kuhlii]